MTDFEDTEEILEGPPLDAGETDEDRPGQLERRDEPYLLLHTSRILRPERICPSKRFWRDSFLEPERAASWSGWS